MSNTNYDCCPICFSEYTLDTIHRPIALKCGHIFGNQCILNWTKNSGSLLCPTCFTKNRKNDIRILYGTSLRVFENNKQNEIFEKYLDVKSQNEKLQREILHYKTCIEYLQAENKRLEELKTEVQQEVAGYVNLCNNESYDYVFKHKIVAKNTHCIVINEQHTNRLIYSARTIDSVGYKIVDLYSYETKYVKVFKKNIEHSFISDLRLSPYNDGLLLISYNNFVKLVNTITNNILTEIKLDNNIVSVSFDNKDRTVIYFICKNGFLHFYDLINLKIQQKIYISKNLLCVCVFYDNIYINSVFECYVFTKFDKKITKFEMPANYRCCNVFVNTDAALLTLKDHESKTLHLFSQKPNKNDKDKIDAYMKADYDEQKDNFTNLLSREIQIIKSRDKIYDNKAYIKNEIKNTIEVYCLCDLVNVKSYTVNDRIIDFDVTKTTLSIITPNYILIYNKEITKR